MKLNREMQQIETLEIASVNRDNFSKPSNLDTLNQSRKEVAKTEQRAAAHIFSIIISSKLTINHLDKIRLNIASRHGRLLSYFKHLNRKRHQPRVELHPRYEQQRLQRLEVRHAQHLRVVNHRLVCPQFQSL